MDKHIPADSKTNGLKSVDETNSLGFPFLIYVIDFDISLWFKLVRFHILIAYNCITLAEYF